jgi:hypothetical protein
VIYVPVYSNIIIEGNLKQNRDFVFMYYYNYIFVRGCIVPEKMVFQKYIALAH